jgi:hypothetical protein
LAVGIAIGFAAAWILRFGGSESAQLVARLQQLEQQQTGLRQHYDGRLRDLQANNARLSGELQSAQDAAEQERSKGNDLLRRLQSADNLDLEKLVDGNVAEAAETFLEMLGGARPGAGRTEYERLRWEYTGSNETPIFRIHEPVWRLVCNLPSARESITMHVFRGERTRDGRPSPVDPISGHGSGAKRINATPGLFYLRIEVRGRAEVSIEPAEVSIDATD